MTVDELIAELAEASAMGMGADPVSCESHGRSSPVRYTEPGDGLEGIIIVGTEIGHDGVERTGDPRDPATRLHLQPIRDDGLRQPPQGG